MNTTIFKIIVIIVLYTLVSCGIKSYTRDTDKIGLFLYDLQYSILYKKTGVYNYPNIKCRYSLRKGNFNGILLLSYAPRELDDNLNSYIGEKDTLFYANFENNTLKEGYIVNKPDGRSSGASDYYRTLYNILDRMVKING